MMKQKLNENVISYFVNLLKSVYTHVTRAYTLYVKNKTNTFTLYVEHLLVSKPQLHVNLCILYYNRLLYNCFVHIYLLIK